MPEPLRVYRCERCQRLSSEPLVTAVYTVRGQRIRTMGGYQEVEGDDEFTNLCPVCIKAAQAVAVGDILVTAGGVEIK